MGRPGGIIFQIAFLQKAMLTHVHGVWEEDDVDPTQDTIELWNQMQSQKVFGEGGGTVVIFGDGGQGLFSFFNH